MPSCSRILIAFAAATVATTSLGAQREPASVPTVLAAVAMGGFADAAGIRPMFVVGAPPAGWPAALTPPRPVLVTGGIVFGPFRTAVFAYPPSSSIPASYEALLRKAGYRPAEPRRGPPRGGFTDSPLQESSNDWCGDSATVMVARVDSALAPHSLVVSIATDREMVRRCGTDPMPRAMGFSMPLPLPTLRPPQGVTTQPGGYSSSGDSFQTTALVDTTLSIDAVLAHYSAELARGGWQLVGQPLLGSGIATRRVTARDKRGDEWQGALIVLTLGARHEVELRMSQPRQW